MNFQTHTMKKSLFLIFALCFLALSHEVGKAAGRVLKDVISLNQNEQPYRTGYHFQPTKNWMNDPNGPMYYNGVYHFFYQYNPYGATFGDVMIWGHAVSHDLVNWIHLDPAIYPTDAGDSNSCWSGSATILPAGSIPARTIAAVNNPAGNDPERDIPAMIYTGSDPHSRQVQDLAWPKDLSDPFLREWVKHPANPLITTPEGVKDDCFRDPSTAWRGSDSLWRMVVGADRDNNGMAFLYQSRDFVNWTRYEKPLSSADATGTWECPDFFPVNLTSTNGLDTSAFSGSVKHVMKAGFEGKDWYTIGTYSPDRENFLPQNGLSLSGSNLDLRYDYGKFYASKSFFDDSKNRRVLWGWVSESDSEEDDIKKGWAGLQSFPRAVWIDRSGKQLIQWPVEEIEALRGKEVNLESKELKSGSVQEIQGITASQADVTISFKLENLEKAEILDSSLTDPQALCTEQGVSSNGAFGPFGLLAMASKDLEEQTAIFFRVFQNKNGRYTVLMCNDLSRSTVRSNIDTTSFGAFVDVDPQHDEISLRSLIDHSIIESFGAGGKTCITSRVYPKFAIGKDAHLFIFNKGTQSVKISKMNAWSMKAAEFTSDEILKSSS